MAAYRLEQEQREEEVGLVAGHGPEQAPPFARLLGGEGDHRDADIGILAQLVGVGMVAVVLAYPPSVAQADQQAASPQADYVVSAPGAEDLPGSRPLRHKAHPAQTHLE